MLRKQGQLAPEQIAKFTVRIGVQRKLVWSFDNRRIITFRSAGMDVPYVKVNKLSQKLLDHLTSETRGESIVIILPPSE
jgi:hypothetical protein